MQKRLSWKLAAIAFLIVLLMIPLAMIDGVVRERAGRQQEVENTVSRSSAGAQALLGPVLAVPWLEKRKVRHSHEKGPDTIEIDAIHGVAVFTPQTLDITADAGVESRYKGLYKALVFDANGKWRAHFDVPANLGLDADPATVTAGAAYVAMGLSDERGIVGQPRIVFDGAPLPLQQGVELSTLQHGLRGVIGAADWRTASRHDVAVDMEVIGTGSIGFVPIGADTKVRVKSAWAHPNFQGEFLPRTREVSEAGFAALWEVSRFASANDMTLAASRPLARTASGGATQGGAPLATLGVAFIEPVNIYQQAERAVKYGALYIVLTFAGFFLVETLKRLRIHPMQYGLVGLALAAFFLLLISLSEHVAFGFAYLGAGGACVALITYYLAHVLKSRGRGLAFGALFTLLYGVLYGVLLSEDNALVLGSLLLFAALAAVMILTRRIDWYDAANPAATTATPAA